MRYNFCVVVLLLVLACQVGYAQPTPTPTPPPEPVWTQVPITDFYDYSTVQQPSQSGWGPFNLYFPGPVPAVAPDALGCTWNQFAGTATGNAVGGQANGTPPNYPIWLQSGSRLSGTIPRGSSQPQQGAVGVVFQDPVRSDTRMKGVSFLGTFSSADDSQGFPIQSVFWESDSCADGDTEYGFFNQKIPNAQGTPIPYTVFYYSYWTNCPASGQYSCVESSTGQQVTPCVGGFTFPTIPPSSNGQYFYNAFPYQDGQGWWFRAEVLDGQSTAPLFACNVNPSLNGGTFNCFDQNNHSASPLGTSNNLTITSSGGTAACSIAPPGNWNTYFSPGWTYGVYGSLFAVIAGGENDNNPVTNLSPFLVSLIKAGK